MAKTIATVLNGGEAPVLSASTTSYTDTKGHWAAPYIEYCTSLGIVEGVGAGAFAPDAPVTAEAAAKMILVAQGFNAVVEGMTGAQWASNTNVLANANGYYAELKDINTAEGASREHVAQMIYNALAATVIEKTNSVNKVTGEVVTTYAPNVEGIDMASKYLKLGTLTGTISEITYADGKYEYTYGVGENKGMSVKTAADYTDLFGMDVKILVKPGKDGLVVYGMFADECEVVYEGVWGDVDTNVKDAKFKIAGTEYKLNKGKEALPTPIAEFNSAEATPDKYEAIKVIDCKADGTVDRIVYSPVKIAKVGYVGKTQITYTELAGAPATKELAKVTAYNGIAADDYVVVTTKLEAEADSNVVLTKLETLKNVTVASTKGDMATINGVAYNNSIKNLAAGAKVGLVVLLNNYIVETDTVDSTVDLSKYAVVTAAGSKVDTYTSTDVAKILTATNPETEVETEAAKNTVDGFVGDLVKYEVKDGKYKFTEVATDTAELALYADTVTSETKYTAETGKALTIKSTAIADDAVVFVKTKDAKDENKFTYSVITGKELAAKASATVLFAGIEKNKATGFNAVTVAYVTETATSTTTAYAYVTDTVVKNVADSKTTYDVALSTGNFVTTDTCDASGIAKGMVVSYEVNAEGKISDIDQVAKTPVAVVAYNGTKIQFEGSDVYEFATDAKIMYVDTKAKTVSEGGTIALADTKIEGGSEVNVKNVAYETKTVDSKTVIALLVVDVNNVWTPLA